MEIIECQHCRTRVLPMSDGICPSCRKSTLEPAANGQMPQVPQSARLFYLRGIICFHFMSIALQLLLRSLLPLPFLRFVDQSIGWPSISETISVVHLVLLILCELASFVSPFAALPAVLYAKHEMSRGEVWIAIIVEITLTWIQLVFLTQLFGPSPNR